MDFIMLAAGTSSRYEGANKLLLPYKETTIVSHCVGEALKASKMMIRSQVIVVTGFEAERIKEELKHFENEITVVENKDYLKGQFNSTKLGISFIKDKNEPFFICPCDMPLISAADYIILKDYYKEEDIAVRPFVRNTPGHPVLINPILIDEILSADDSKSMKEILSTGHVKKLNDEYGNCIRDIDTVESYRCLKKT